MLHLLNLLFQLGDEIIGFQTIELRNSLDFDLSQSRHIFVCHFTNEVFDVWLEAFVNVGNDLFPSLCLFDIAVDSLLDEDFLERSKMPLLF